MELLHGKAKEDFYKWVQNNYDLLIEDCGGFGYFWNAQTKVSEYALIIEWLDSVGLEIGIEPLIDSSFRSFVLGYANLHCWIENRFDSRKEAITEAIKKAVEIFNEKHI